MKKRKLTVIVADDHQSEVVGISNLLGFIESIKVVDTATTTPAAVRKVMEKTPDVILIDINWLGRMEPGLNAIRQIRDGVPETRILAMTNYDELLEPALKAGADLAIHKNFLNSTDDYEKQIMAAYDARLLPQVSNNKSTFEKLSRREMEVLELMCDGLADKEIANSLTISLGTEKKYVTGLYRKLQVKGRAEAVSKALQSGLLYQKKKPEE